MNALGGKASLGTSPIIEAEREIFREFRADLKKIGTVNSPEKALEYRKALIKIYPNLKKAFIECGFSVD